MRRIDELAQALAEERTTSRSLIEESLARIADPDGEGPRVFIKIQAEQARAMADAVDGLRRVGRSPGRYAGLPIVLKDLQSWPTRLRRTPTRPWWTTCWRRDLFRWAGST